MGLHPHAQGADEQRGEANKSERGDCWLWASIDPVSKCIINWQTGKRTAAAARSFAGDLATRIKGRVQITSDQLQGYAFAVPFAFGERADYAQEHKIFQSSRVAAHEWPRYRVDPLVGVNREAMQGNPNLATATVCHIERFFLTMRQGNKRCARKTLAYSKSWDNHALTASIHIFVYNLVRKHEGIGGKTPAVILGIADRRWTLEDVIEMTERYLRAQDDRKFEIAFASKFSETPRSMHTFTPTPKDQIPVPWYLDPESGGPNPVVKKPGVRYDADSQGGTDGNVKSP